MKPVTIKPVVVVQAPVSAMTVNTQVRTGVSMVRREVQSSAGFYLGPTVELTVDIEANSSYLFEDNMQVCVMSATGTLKMRYWPNNAHAHEVEVTQQFMCDYLITNVELFNYSEEPIKVNVTYVPFSGTLPDEEPEGVKPYRVKVDYSTDGGNTWSGPIVLPTEPEDTIQLENTITTDTQFIFPTIRVVSPADKIVQLRLDLGGIGPGIADGNVGPDLAIFDASYSNTEWGEDGNFVRVSIFHNVSWPIPTYGLVPSYFWLKLTAINQDDGDACESRDVHTETLTPKPPVPQVSASPRYLGWLPTPQSVSKIDFFYYIPTQASSYSSSIRQTNNQSSSNGVISINSATKVLTITLDTLSLSNPDMPIDRVSLYDGDSGTWESANIFAYALNAFEVEHDAFSDGVSTKINFRASMTSAYEMSAKEWPVFKFGGFVMDSGGGGESIGNIIVPMTKLWLGVGYSYTQFGAVFVKSFSSVSSGYLTYDIGFVSPITNNTEWFRYSVQNISYVDSAKMLSLVNHNDIVVNTTNAAGSTSCILAYSELQDRSHLGFFRTVSVDRVSSLQQGLLPPTIKDDAHDPYITYSAVITDYDTQYRPIQGATRGVVSFNDYRNGLDAYDLDGTTQVLVTFKGQGVGLVGDLRNCTINYFNPD